MEVMNQFYQWVRDSKRICFFGGAGVSTESGIPDFRSAKGIYSKDVNQYFSPEELVSHTAYRQYPEMFFDFYKNYLIYPHAKPNAAHQALAQMEKDGKLTAVVTQNIDTLHEQAGSKNVIKLHGSVDRNRCTKCGKLVDLSTFLKRCEPVPHCECGGIIKPEVVLYEEPLQSGVMEAAIEAIRCSDMLIIGGTSLVVYPAAGLIRYFKGKYLVLINQSYTVHDNEADLVIREPIGQFFESFMSFYWGKR